MHPIDSDSYLPEPVSSVAEGVRIATDLPPEYARILKNITTSDAHKAEMVRQLRVLVYRIVQRYIDEVCGLNDED